MVLGYIQNQTRVSKPSQWFYVNTCDNPSDCATRPSRVINFLESFWLSGPTCGDIQLNDKNSDTFPLVSPNDDTEIRPEVSALRTSVKSKVTLGSRRFERFSSWSRLISAIEILLHISQTFK